MQAERGGRVGFEQGVANEEAVALGAEDDFLFEEHTADAINPGGHFVPLKTKDVFMTLRTVVFSNKFVKTEVEFCSMLDDGLIEGRKEHVVFIVDFLYGHDKKSVIFADVAAHEGGRAVGTRFVGEQKLLHEGVLQVGHLRFVELQE